MRFMLRFPLSLLFLLSLLPILVIKAWPEMPGVGEGEPLVGPMQPLIAPAYLLVALAHVAGFRFPWSIALILLCLGLADVRIMQFIRRMRSGTLGGN